MPQPLRVRVELGREPDFAVVGVDQDDVFFAVVHCAASFGVIGTGYSAVSRWAETTARAGLNAQSADRRVVADRTPPARRRPAQRRVGRGVASAPASGGALAATPERARRSPRRGRLSSRDCAALSRCRDRRAARLPGADAPPALRSTITSISSASAAARARSRSPGAHRHQQHAEIAEEVEQRIDRRPRRRARRVRGRLVVLSARR